MTPVDVEKIVMEVVTRFDEIEDAEKRYKLFSEKLAGTLGSGGFLKCRIAFIGVLLEVLEGTCESLEDCMLRFFMEELDASSDLVVCGHRAPGLPKLICTTSIVDERPICERVNTLMEFSGSLNLLRSLSLKNGWLFLKLLRDATKCGCDSSCKKFLFTAAFLPK